MPSMKSEVVRKMSVAVLTTSCFFFSLSTVCGWQTEWEPNSVIRIQDYDDAIQVFPGKDSVRDDFRLLLAEGDSMLVGAINMVYNISLVTLETKATIDWSPEQSHIDVCQKHQKSLTECQNYIRVLYKKSPDTVYMCGTSAFKPTCRTYKQKEDGTYTIKKSAKADDVGTAKCPYDPSHNTTAIYSASDQKLYSATVSDFSSRDPLIMEFPNLVRTEQYDSKWLNEPNFVSAFEKDDKIYFFFRETAVENINCGKAVFSRVARVCKHDQGGNDMLLYKTFTSFFKARLNCSIPGDFPFYFDEIQATTEMGQGYYRPTYDSGDRSDMMYAVFNTPQNSIQGSAICAFRYSDLTATFEGRFKGQESYWHNWLAVSWDDTPQPHPQQCTNSSRSLPHTTLNFIKTHPLMNNAVPAVGGAPLIFQTSFRSQFTKIAVDWQVHAADGRYYDVMFIGTSDGRVIKAVNKGVTTVIDTAVIEDIRVFDSHESVTDLKIFRDRLSGVGKLIVMSNQNIVSIPLHRCHKQNTCRTCVELQDPYCVWAEGECLNAERGIQNVVNGWSSGWHRECEDVSIFEENKPREETTTNEPLADKCKCTTVVASVDTPQPTMVKEDIGDIIIPPGADRERKVYEEDIINRVPKVGKSSEETLREPLTSSVSVETLVIAIVVAIVLSMLLGFGIGFKVSSCRRGNGSDTSYLERTCSLQRSRNRLSSGEHPGYYNPDHAIIPKQMNYAVNVKGKLNSAVETKPVTKSNKVYL